MNKRYLLVSALPLFLLIQSCNQQQNNNIDDKAVDKTGVAFIQAASEASQTEIKAATLAQSTSKNPRVTGFAKMMIKDCDSTLQKIQDIKTQVSIATKDELTAEHKKLIDSLSKLQGEQFDKAYMKTVLDHIGKTDILFINASQNKSILIDSLARKSMPRMQVHLDSARKIVASFK